VTTYPRQPVVAAMVGSIVPAVVVAVTAAVNAGELPDTLPVHWSGLGNPDRFAATGSVLWWTLGSAAVAVAIATVAVTVHRRHSLAIWLVTLATGLGGLAAAVWLTSLVTTVAAADPRDARLGWNVLWIPAGIAWAATFTAVAGRNRPSARQPTREPALAPTGPRSAWVTVLRPGPLVTVPLVAAGTVAVVAVTTEPAIWPAVALPLVAVLLFANLRVIADRRGLRIVAGPILGSVSAPVKRIPLTDIVTATAEHIDPLKWGGWGYRVIPGRSALVLRAGPGLVLHLRDGRRFAVTVDDPDTPAALLTNLRRAA
jgi:hypothetical protein